MKKYIPFLIVALLALGVVFYIKKSSKKEDSNTQDHEDLSSFSEVEIDREQIENTIKGDRKLKSEVAKRAIEEGRSFYDELQITINQIIKTKLSKHI